MVEWYGDPGLAIQAFAVARRATDRQTPGFNADIFLGAGHDLFIDVRSFLVMSSRSNVCH